MTMQFTHHRARLREIDILQQMSGYADACGQKAQVDATTTLAARPKRGLHPALLVLMVVALHGPDPIRSGPHRKPQ